MRVSTISAPISMFLGLLPNCLSSMLSLSTFGPPFARRSRLERHLKKLIPDDVLLQREGMGERLTRPELLDALEERGMCVVVISLL